MRTYARMALLAGLALAASSSQVASISELPNVLGDPHTLRIGKQRRGKGSNNRRGKGLRAKPKKRPNRLTISKRVRRKHRRAAQ